MKCVACGSTALVEGALIDTSGGSASKFKAKDVSIWKGMFGMGVREVRAYGCIRCHHLQLAVDFSEEDMERYQQFEGEQPGVLERLNADQNKIEN